MVHTCECAQVCNCMNTYGSPRGGKVSFSVALYHNALRQGLSLDWKFTTLARLAGICLASNPKARAIGTCGRHAQIFKSVLVI